MARVPHTASGDQSGGEQTGATTLYKKLFGTETSIKLFLVENAYVDMMSTDTKIARVLF